MPLSKKLFLNFENFNDGTLFRKFIKNSKFHFENFTAGGISPHSLNWLMQVTIIERIFLFSSKQVLLKQELEQHQFVKMPQAYFYPIKCD